MATFTKRDHEMASTFPDNHLLGCLALLSGHSFRKKYVQGEEEVQKKSGVALGGNLTTVCSGRQTRRAQIGSQRQVHYRGGFNATETERSVYIMIT